MYLFKIVCVLFLLITVNCQNETAPGQSTALDLKDFDDIDPEVVTGEPEPSTTLKSEETTKLVPSNPEEDKDSKDQKNPDVKPDDQKKEEDQSEKKEEKKEETKEETKEEKKEIEHKTEAKSGLRKGSVWGIAIGIIGMVATTVMLIVFILKRRRGDDRLIR